jgi:predicted RNA-binding protein with TRAM domain
LNDKKPPVKEGEEHSAIVGNVGEKGDGILRIKGFVVFVPRVEKGDFVKIRITKVLPKVAFGELVEKLKSPQEMFKPKAKPIDPEIEKLLHTENDSESFGDEDDEDEDL